MNMKNKLVLLMIIFLLTIGLVSYKLYDRMTTSSTSLDPIPNSNSSIKKKTISKSKNNATPTNKTVRANNSVLNENIIKSISVNDYILNLQTSTYTVGTEDTTSTILRPFEATCNYNTAIKHLKLLNPVLNLSSLEIGSTIKIPTEAFKAGHLYRIVSGDTFYKIAKSNYPNYNAASIIELLISINDLPNKDCPLGENIFLPSL